MECSCGRKISVLERFCSECGERVSLLEPAGSCPLCGTLERNGLGPLIRVEAWLLFSPIDEESDEESNDSEYLVGLGSTTFMLSTPASDGIREAVNAVYREYLKEVDWLP